MHRNHLGAYVSRPTKFTVRVADYVFQASGEADSNSQDWTTGSCCRTDADTDLTDGGGL